jgi:hypothetical protein
MAAFDGITRKFTVIKNEDVEKYLDERERFELTQLLWKIDQLRLLAGKPINVYLVTNIDEPYALEVAELMKLNGHLGETAEDPNQVEAQIADNTLLLPIYEMGD